MSDDFNPNGDSGIAEPNIKPPAKSMLRAATGSPQTIPEAGRSESAIMGDGEVLPQLEDCHATRAGGNGGLRVAPRSTGGSRTVG